MATAGEDAPLTSAQVHGEDEEFDISTWCKDHGLSRKTQQMLAKEELTTADALVLLEPNDLRELNIPFGQRKLLQQALASLHTASGTHDAPGTLCKGDSEPPQANSGAAYGGESGAGIIITDIRRQAASLGQAGKAFDVLFSPEPLVPRNKTVPGADSKGHPQAPELPMSHADPSIILTMKAGSNKAVHITAFLNKKK